MEETLPEAGPPSTSAGSEERRLHEKRQASLQKLQHSFEAIYAKFGRRFDGEADVLDLTGEDPIFVEEYGATEVAKDSTFATLPPVGSVSTKHDGPGGAVPSKRRKKTPVPIYRKMAFPHHFYERAALASRTHRQAESPNATLSPSKMHAFFSPTIAMCPPRLPLTALVNAEDEEEGDEEENTDAEDASSDPEEEEEDDDVDKPPIPSSMAAAHFILTHE